MFAEVKLISAPYWNEVAEQRRREDRLRQQRQRSRQLLFNASLAVFFAAGLATGLMFV